MLRSAAMLRKVALEIAGTALLAGAVALGACTAITGSSATSNVQVSTYVPLTSIEVDASSLLSRLGCGPEQGLPYKYVVSVYDADPPGVRRTSEGGAGTPILIGTSDCFANAVFQNVPSGQGVTLAWFSLTVDVFDLPTYQANRAAIDAPTVEQAGAIHAAANWSTTCVATQQANVQSVAACGPLP